ncbi:hypothetical protein WA026_005963 [Henosepilachna vigintioctopunctata]|uniref:EF-hand domain-containing protein n=1 Tax=Henosepilachna vigintioctopunctata TaxID=420089 RepID=A0AAW1TUD3_9CUCU
MAEDKTSEVEEEEFGQEELQEIEEAYNIYAIPTGMPADDDEEEPPRILGTHNLAAAMKDLGYEPTEAETFAMIDQVDPDKTGFIDFKTFIYLLRKNVKTMNEDDLRIAFAVFDKDGNGTISIPEIKYITLHLGLQYPPDEIEDMMREADGDGDGKISFEDFAYFMTRK